MPANLQKIYDLMWDNYKGLTSSPGCILVQGFPGNEELTRIREAIRTIFKGSSLPHSIDSRYKLETAHSTIARFKTQFIRADTFAEQVRKHRAVPVGTFTLDFGRSGV